MAVWLSKAWVNWLIPGGTFQLLVENSPLPLQLAVLGPLYKAGKVSFRLDVLSNAEVLLPLLEQGVHHLLGFLLLDHGRDGATFFPLTFFPFGILGSSKRELY